MPSVSRPKIAIPPIGPVRFSEPTGELLLFTTPMMTSSLPLKGVESVTAVEIEPFAAIVITALQPVPVGSGGWTKAPPELVPVPGESGQTVPPNATPTPNTNSAPIVTFRSLKLLPSGQSMSPRPTPWHSKQNYGDNRSIREYALRVKA